MKEELFSPDANNTTMAHINREKEAQKEHGLSNNLAKAFIDSIKEVNFYEILANAIACELKKIIEKKEIEELLQHKKKKQIDLSKIPTEIIQVSLKTILIEHTYPALPYQREDVQTTT